MYSIVTASAPHLLHVGRHDVILLLVPPPGGLGLAAAARLGVPDDVG